MRRRTLHLLILLLRGDFSPSPPLCPLPHPLCLLHHLPCHALRHGHLHGLLSGQQLHLGTLLALVGHGHFHQSQPKF